MGRLEEPPTCEVKSTGHLTQVVVLTACFRVISAHSEVINLALEHRKVFDLLLLFRVGLRPCKISAEDD
jgi:hypothetical protein